MTMALTAIVVVSLIALSLTWPRPQQPIVIQLEPVQPPTGHSFGGAVLVIVAVLLILSLALP